MSYRRTVINERVDVVRLTGGPGLAVRGAQGPLRPFLLVHDLGSDAAAWDGVAQRLAAAGHEVSAVDLRGHGGSEAPGSGYDTDTCADDLATLLELLGHTGGRSPVVAGHGWGANVVMSLAARRDGVAAVCCVDGGWLRPAWRYASFDDYWQSLAVDDDAGAADRSGAGNVLPEDRRRSIVQSIFRGEPRAWYPLVRVPVALCPVVPPDGRPDPAGRGTAARTGVAEAAAGLPKARVSWYYGDNGPVGADPAKLVDDLLALAADAEPQVDSAR